MVSIQDKTIGSFMSDLKSHTKDTFSEFQQSSQPLTISNSLHIISKSQERLFYLGVFLIVVGVVILCVT
jgi:hypothetical protein